MSVIPLGLPDRYRAVRLLGEGGSARTFLCDDAQAGRQVALKELRVEHLESWKHLELFEREARVLAALRHHGIPEVFDSFERADAQGRKALYLVQEYVEGSSLRERIEKGPLLGELEVVELTLALLDVLDYLHGRAPPVYHRDIKPSNVILRPGGHPALIDFGGVCFGWRPDGGTTVVGTYGYMAPEQLMGQVGPRSDLYSLGATLLHLVTGQPPSAFSSDAGRLEVPAELPVRPALRRLLGALLEPAPRDRPQTARAARELLLAPADRALVPARPLPALRPRAEGGVLVGRDVPQFVDVGPPPRDPRGPFRDVYLTLVDPLNPVPAIRSAGLRTLARVGILAGFLLSLGIAPAVYYADRAGRRRRYHDLFVSGVLVEGRIVSFAGTPQHNIYATIGYEYEVAGQRYRAFMKYEIELTAVCAIGDPVAVLHAPDDPARSCFAYRKIG